MDENKTLFQKLINDEDYHSDLSVENKSSVNIRIILMIFTLFGLSSFFIFQGDKGNSDKLNIEIGTKWTDETIIASRSFPIFKDREQIEKEKNEAENKVLFLFDFDENAKIESLNYLNAITSALPQISNNNDIEEINISGNVLKAFSELSTDEKEKKSKLINSIIKDYLENIYKNGFIDISKEKLNNTNIAIRKSPSEEFILKNEYLTDKNEFINKAKNYIANKLNETNSEIAYAIIENIINPNLIYNENLTEKEKKLARNSIVETKDFVDAGTEIIAQNETIDKRTFDILKNYFKAEEDALQNKYTVTFIMGSIGHAAILYSILILYLFVMRKKFFYDNLSLLIISITLIFSSFLSWISIQFSFGYPVEYLIFIPALSMLTAVVFDSRTAFYVTFTMSLLLAGIRGNDYAAGTTMIFSGTLAAYTVKDIQNRTQMFQSMFYIFLGLAISILVFSAQKSIDWNFTLQKLGIALINSALSPLFTFGLIIILERLSPITTDLKIKEYDNLDHPLLVKLSEVAPGTYQHSLGVANLAERCAKKINGNPLLVKVGAYFHDIGKMVKPEYFTENQIDIENKHDLLPPKKSAQIIKAHVTDGKEMAIQYKLPQRLIDFIVTHHGTTLIKHFYAEALEQSDENEVKEDDFRYPGPKPKTIDEAIVMICDSAEAITRVVSKSEDEIIAILEQHIKERILDGQFDNCGITLEEIQIVKDTIYKTLKGLGHQRVAYKEIPKDKIKK